MYICLNSRISKTSRGGNNRPSSINSSKILLNEDVELVAVEMVVTFVEIW